MLRILVWFIVTAAFGALLAMLGIFYAAAKLRLSFWVVPKAWFFFVVGVVLVGSTLELVLWLKQRRKKRDLKKPS